MRSGFWTGMLTGALLGALLVMVMAPEARDEITGMADGMELAPMGRRFGQAARRLVRRTGIRQALDDLTR